jgi:hypothetical protein
VVYPVNDKRIVCVVRCSTRHVGLIVVKQRVPFLCDFRGVYPVIPKITTVYTYTFLRGSTQSIFVICYYAMDLPEMYSFHVRGYHDLSNNIMHLIITQKQSKQCDDRTGSTCFRGMNLL